MTPAPVAALCVYCREKPADPQWRPFCSRRCQLLDLSRWADGDYRVPGDPVEPNEVEPAPDGRHDSHES